MLQVWVHRSEILKQKLDGIDLLLKTSCRWSLMG